MAGPVVSNQINEMLVFYFELVAGNSIEIIQLDKTMNVQVPTYFEAVNLQLNILCG